MTLNFWMSRIGLGCLIALSAAAQAPGTPPIMDREKEIALALSSCPATISSQAAVYVLEKAGYVKARDGKNGFTAIVQRVRPESLDPQCMDAEASRTFLPRMLKLAELRSQGKKPEEIRTLLSDAVALGILPVPAQPGIIYMLSSRNFNTNGKGETFPPHVMIYGTHMVNADLGVDGADLGLDGNPKGAAFVAGEGSPFSLLIVPVGSRGAGATHEH
jgi:hypothetical protein